MTAWLVLLLLSLNGGLPVAKQAQAPVRDTTARISAAGTATIAGSVVSMETSPSPIRRAVVTLTGTGISTFVQAVTDDDGRFVFSAVPAGRFSITAEKPAYLKSYYGSTRVSRPPGMPIAVAEAQQYDNVTIPMARGAVLSGRVVDEFGVPVASTQVQIQYLTIVDGVRKPISPPTGTNWVPTDDRGVFRAYGLMPGQYLIRTGGGGATRVVTQEEIDRALRPAGSPGGAMLSSPPQFSRALSYYGNTLSLSDAIAITLAAGDERADIDIVSQLTRSARVEGVAIAPDGQPASNISVGIASVSAGALHSSMGIVRADANGRFVIPALPSGRWMLFGRAAPPNMPSDSNFPWWGRTEFVVADQHVSGVVLAFTAGSTVSGRIAFKGSAVPIDLARLRVDLTPLPGIPETGASVVAATPAADGTFSIRDVPPGRYRINLSSAAGWSLLSVTAAGRDVLDTPLEVPQGEDVALAVIMTDQVTEISGRLIDQLDRPAPEYSMVVFSANRAHWATSPRRMSGVVKVGSDGTYRISGLPAGDYILCVITDVEPGSLTDPAFLEELVKAGVPITLGEGEKRKQDFKIGVGDPETGNDRLRRVTTG
jgi:hypothetical protein